MNMFYVFVDFKEKIILSPIQKLPENWNNINGLNGYDESLLKDLSWAGHHNRGWIPYTSKDLREYSYDEEWLESSKLNIIKEISDERKVKSSSILSFLNQKIKLDNETKISLMFIRLNLINNPKKNVAYNFLNETVQLRCKDFLNLYNFIDDYLQSCLQLEINLKNKIQSADNFGSLQNINLDIEWPKKDYQKKISIRDIINNIIENLKELIDLLIGKTK